MEICNNNEKLLKFGFNTSRCVKVSRCQESHFKKFNMTCFTIHLYKKFLIYHTDMASFTLKAVTAPGELFESREALAAHYSSPLHLYNLKRKNGGMRLVTREEFEKRVEAAKQMKEENEAAQLREGRGHLKNKDEVDSSSASSTNTTSITNKPQHDIDDDADPADMTIDPSSSLFDPTTHTTCQLALDHMQTTNNFTLPFSEQIIDLEGLLGYLHEKVKLGHMCLECERVFRSVRGCRDHMKAERHQRVANKGWDETEFGCFYDFDIGKEKGASTIIIAEGNEVENDDDEVDIDSDDDSYYDEYQRNLAANGYQINTFGELEVSE